MANPLMAQWRTLRLVCPLHVHNRLALGAIHGYQSSGDEAGPLRPQKDYHVGDLLGGTQAPQGHAPNRSLLGFGFADALLSGHSLHQSPPPLGVYGAWVDRVDQDTVGSQFFGNSQGEIDACCIGGSCGDLKLEGLDAVVTDNVDDAPPPSLFHVRNGAYGCANLAQKF